MTLTEAYAEARERAETYDGEDCIAAHAWTNVARRRRTRTTHWSDFYEALDDAHASEDADLVLAVQTIAASQIAYCERFKTAKAQRIADNIRQAVA